MGTAIGKTTIMIIKGAGRDQVAFQEHGRDRHIFDRIKMDRFQLRALTRMVVEHIEARPPEAPEGKPERRNPCPVTGDPRTITTACSWCGAYGLDCFPTSPAPERRAEHRAGADSW
jgi:hypothetical protein